MEAVGSFLPELDPAGEDPHRAPVLGTGNGAVAQLGVQRLELGTQRLDALDLFALTRDVRLQLMIARTGGKQIFGELSLRHLPPTLNPNLATERRPVKNDRKLGIEP